MITFTIPGRPQPQGSKRHVGRGIMIETNKDLRPWRDSAIWHAAQQRPHAPGGQFTGPVHVVARFHFARPASHFGTGRNATRLKASAPEWMSSAPDADKLARALGDALTQSGLIRDDRLIVSWRILKRYGETAHTQVLIGGAS